MERNLMKKVDVSIVIVSYNTKDILLECVSSVIKTTKDISYELIIVDNNSSDGTVEEISKLKSQNSKPQLKTQNFPNILQLNRKEASDFFGVNFVDEEIWKAEHCPTSPETILIITDGSHGGRICSRGICSWYKGIKTKMVDSTGAGDAFGSGFVAALMSGKQIEEAIEWGKKQAANVVKFIGAKKGLMTADNF